MHFSQKSFRSNNSISEYVFNRFTEYNDNIEKLKLAKNIMFNAKTVNLAYHINNELRRKYKDSEQIFTQDEYNELGKSFRSRVMDETNDDLPVFEKIQNVNQIRYLFNNWISNDLQGLHKYLENIIVLKPNKIHYLLSSIITEESNFSDNIFRKANFDAGCYHYLKSIIDVNLVYKLINENYFEEINNVESRTIEPFEGDKQTETNVLRQFIDQYKYDNKINMQ